jgi:hypothetical protein
MSHGNYPPINMSHLELFNHFWTVTSETLVFGVQMWSETLLRYSFKVIIVSPSFIKASRIEHGKIQGEDISNELAA